MFPLTEDSDAAFDVFARFLYNQPLFDASRLNPSLAVDAWLFAQKILVPKLQNEIMRSLLD